MGKKKSKENYYLTVRKYKRTPFSRAKYYPARQRIYSWGAFAQPFLWGASHGDWQVVLIATLSGLLPSLAILNGIHLGMVGPIAAINLLIIHQLLATITRLWLGVRFQNYIFKPDTVSSRLSLKLQTAPERVMVVEQFWAEAGIVLFALRSLFLAALYYIALMGYPDNTALIAAAVVMAWFVFATLSMYYISRYEDRSKELFEENFDYRVLSHFKYSGASFLLANKVVIPALGFGTYKITNPDEVYSSVTCALETGYRLIDTASFYQNEEAIGCAIKDSGIARESLFITSKVWNDQQGYVETVAAFEESLKKLGLDYLDLLLVHWPVESTLHETWRAFEDLFLSGRIKAIGVCNFEIEHIEMLAEKARVMPLVNQIELHPRFQRSELVRFCQQRRIHVEAWASLMRGGIFEIPELLEIADRYERTPAQVALQWAFQKGYTVLPKSTTPDRIRENYAGVNCFELTDEDMKLIDSLDTNMRIGPDPAKFSWAWPESTR